MQTGYDSFWMYQNSRHEPVLNLPKNDNQSHAVLTDSYKQVQSGGHPSLLNRCIPAQNDIARSRTTDQLITPQSQCVWPSAVYPVPLKPSYVSNYHPQAAFSSQSNNSGYLPHYAQQNLSNGNFRNHSSSVPQVQNSSSDNLNSGTNSTLIGDNQNGNAHSARLRVRDVFSLNKSTVSNEVLNNNSYPKGQNGYFNYNSAYSAESQSQFVNYGRGNLSPANPAPYYPAHQMENPTTAVPTQFHQNSASYYQQNPGNQQPFMTNGLLNRTLNFEASRANPQNVSAAQQLHSPRNSQDQCILNTRRVSSESVLGNEIVNVVPKRSVVQLTDSIRTVNPGYGDSLDVNNRLPSENSSFSNIPQVHAQQDDNCLFRNNKSSNSVSNPLTTTSLTSPTYQRDVGQGTVIKISIPHSGQSTLITLNDSAGTNKSSTSHFPLEGNDKFFSEWDKSNPNHNNNANENNVPNVSVCETHKTSFSNSPVVSSVSLPSPKNAQNCHDAESEYRKSLIVPPRKRFCQMKEPFLDLDKENLNDFLNSTALTENVSDDSIPRLRDSESIARETTFQEKITLSTFELKQEKLNAKVESPALDPSASEKRVMFEIIKREKNPADENTVMEENAAEPSGESNAAEEPPALEDEFTEDVNVDVKEFPFLPEVSQPAASAELEIIKHSENCREVENLNNSRDSRKNSSTENKGSGQEQHLPTEVNYKSRINRNKLDMLIQFLEMDENSVEMVKDEGKSRKEVDLNHNRRKLSKTSVVKNRNNSREMISMKSNKSGRAEPSKCSPPAPQIAVPNSEAVGEGKNSANEKSKANLSGNASESAHMKFNLPRVTQTEGEKSSEKSESKRVSGSAATRIQEASEESKRTCGVQKAENLISRIQALQALESIFCWNCDLDSSPESFWINIASGELSCLNCFKKIKAESESDTVSNSTGKTVRKEKTEKRSSDCVNETIKQEPIDSIDFPTVTRMETTSEQKASDLNEERQIKNSEVRSKGEAKNGKSKRKDSVSKESSSSPRSPKEGSTNVKSTSVENLRKDQPPEQSLRKSISKDHHDCSKRQDNIRKSTQKEDEAAEEHAKRDRKSAEGSSHVRKRSNSKDFACKSPEEHSKKEGKSIVDSADRCVKKNRESYPTPKDSTAEQTTKKSTKHEHSEKAKRQSPSKESDSSEECRVKSTNSSEKRKKIDSTGQSRKRKHSDEDVGPAKVRIVEEQTKKDTKPVQHRTGTSNTSKEDTEKHKTKGIDGEPQSVRNSVQRAKTNSFSKEDAEHLPNSSKEKDALREDVIYQKIKAYEQAKQRASESAEVVRRKSKDEQVVQKHSKNETKQVVDEKEKTSEKRKIKEESRGEHFGEHHKHGSVTTENKERKKTEEKEKNQCSKSRPLKENQNAKAKSEKHKERREHRKSSEEKNDDKRGKEAPEKRDKKKPESDSDKKKRSDQAEGKREKIQTENRHGNASEKMAERYLGSKTENSAVMKSQEQIDSAKLLSKLQKKTKKLSLSLLSEA